MVFGWVTLAVLYLFLLFGSRCFVAFEVTDTIDDTLGGNALNLVRPLGWAGISAMLFGWFVTILLGRWISCQKRDGVEDTPVEADKRVVAYSSEGGDGPTELSSKEAEEMHGGKMRRGESVATLYEGRYNRCFGSCCT